MTATSEKLYPILKHRQVMSLAQILSAVGCSRRTAIRSLQDLQYLSSYSHTGRFYTLVEIPTFNPLGLWHYEDIHFSRWGSLKKTVVQVVAQSPAGYSHRELVDHLRVRCHNALLDLTTAARLHREKRAQAGPYVYLSSDPVVQSQQFAERRGRWEKQVAQARVNAPFPSPPLAPRATIAVVVELLKDPQASPATITHRVQSYGFKVSVREVHQVFRTYELDKKRAL